MYRPAIVNLVEIHRIIDNISGLYDSLSARGVCHQLLKKDYYPLTIWSWSCICALISSWILGCTWDIALDQRLLQRPIQLLALVIYLLSILMHLSVYSSWILVVDWLRTVHSSSYWVTHYLNPSLLCIFVLIALVQLASCNHSQSVKIRTINQWMKGWSISW